MMKTTSIGLVVLLSSSLLVAEKPKDINGALKLGTLGYGVDLSSPFNDTFALRVNVNGISITETDSQDGTDFEGTLDLFTAGALIDYYPFENNFRLSSGLYYNGNGFTGSAKPSAGSTVEIDGNTYTLGNTGDIGSLDSEVSFKSTAPYVGLGWGNDAKDKGWGFTFDLGAMYHGSGTADLKANINNQTLANEIAADVEAEEQNIKADLEEFKFYPVLSLGVNYTF
jgi:hypothetical protein